METCIQLLSEVFFVVSPLKKSQLLLMVDDILSCAFRPDAMIRLNSKQ
jgi:hypothetical protein